MRRSSKPWYRFRNIALLTLGLAAAVVGWAVVRAWTAKPGPPVDYAQKLVELVESHQPGSRGDANAWDPFMEAVRTFGEVEAQLLAAQGGKDAMPADWPQDNSWPVDYVSIRDPRTARIVLDQTVLAMDLMRERGVPGMLAEMAATPRAVRPRAEATPLIGVLLPELGSARNIARWCIARMYVASRRGDMAEVVATFEQSLAVARVVGSQWTLIDRLVAVAIASMMMSEVKYQLGEGLLDAAACRELLAAIDRQLPMPPMELALNGERGWFMDAVQWTHTDDGRGSGRLILTKLYELERGSFEHTSPGIAGHPIINLAGFVLPSRAETVGRANEFYDLMIAQSKLTAAERRAAPVNFDAMVESLPRGQLLLRMMLPAIGRSLSSHDQYEVEVAGTRIMLALEVFRAEQGRYPDTLEELVPGVLASLPVDPFSGKPYAYRQLREGESMPGWRYMLYSVGADGTDDGGTEPASSKYKALQGGESGSDFLINEARPAPK